MGKNVGLRDHPWIQVAFQWMKLKGATLGTQEKQEETSMEKCRNAQQSLPQHHILFNQFQIVKHKSQLERKAKLNPRRTHQKWYITQKHRGVP